MNVGKENWLALLKRLHEDNGAAVLLPWGNETEKERTEAIAAKLPFAQVCAKMNLLQAAYVLQQADSFQTYRLTSGIRTRN